MTLGSLFDGSGGFPLAGMMAGIKTRWSSEIEPFPILVTHKRFPCVKHYGDVSKLSGAELEPVDVITFGSPCQDLSIAGARAGLREGERSNLFFQAIRIIKEMRKATNGEYPRYAVWENVTGAFNSHKGEDFRTVLESFCEIKEERVSIPMPEKRWENAGTIMGDGYSLAWRTLDAQYWGVPQRRKRIFLVGDFGGECAGKILFKPESVPGDFTQSGKEREDATADIERGVGVNNSILCLNEGAWTDITVNISGTLRVCGNLPVVFDARGYGCGDICPTITGDDECRITNYTALIVANPSLKYIVRRLTPTECARLQGFPAWWCNDLADMNPTEDEIAFWVDVWREWNELNDKKPKTEKWVRKWLANPYTDSAQYKMWGNGVALPCVAYIMAGIAGKKNIKLK